MRKCLKTCKSLGVTCPIKECRYWIESRKENNCMFESINANGAMTLREVGDRLGVSFVRIKQIESAALKKISRLIENESI